MMRHFKKMERLQAWLLVLVFPQFLVFGGNAWADDPLKTAIETTSQQQPTTDGSKPAPTSSGQIPSGSIGIGNTLLPASDIDVDALKGKKSQSFADGNKRLVLTENGKGSATLSIQAKLPPKKVRGKVQPTEYKNQESFTIKAADLSSLTEISPNVIEFKDSVGQRITLTIDDETGKTDINIVKLKDDQVIRKVERVLGPSSSDKVVTLKDTSVSGSLTTEKTYDPKKGTLLNTTQTKLIASDSGASVTVVTEQRPGEKVPTTKIVASDGDLLYQGKVSLPAVMPDKNGGFFLKAQDSDKKTVIFSVAGPKGEEDLNLFRQVPPPPAPRPGTKPALTQEIPPQIEVNGRKITVQPMINPEQDLWKPPVQAFEDVAIKRIFEEVTAANNGAMPIEGWGPLVGQEIFPGIVADDYKGANTLSGGEYKVNAETGRLEVKEPPVANDGGPILFMSGGGSLTQEGNREFVENAARRLRINLTDSKGVEKLIEALKNPPPKDNPMLMAPIRMTVADRVPVEDSAKTAPAMTVATIAPVTTAPAQMCVQGAAGCSDVTLPTISSNGTITKPLGWASWTREQQEAWLKADSQTV